MSNPKPHIILRGFTLIEILVVIAIIGILATVATLNFSGTTASSRDAQRQADLKNLQNAIETYRSQNGQYPLGCNGPNVWSGQLGTNYECNNSTPPYDTADGTGQYIMDLAPEYISVLPIDPKFDVGDVGYVYTTNSNRTVYKVMAMNTVEEEIVNYNHPLKSCDIRPDSIGRIQAENNVDISGWCYRVAINNGVFENPPNPVRCRMSTPPNNSDNGNGRFEKSYGVWGGFEALTTGAATSSRVRNTTAIICK